MNRHRWLVLAAVLAIVVLAILGSARGRDPQASSAPSAAALSAPSAAASSAPAAAASTGLESAGTVGLTPTESMGSPILPPSATSGAGPTTGVGPTSSIASSTSLPLAALLDLLPVREERRAGYSRALFVLWIDADGDGCNTRREVLIEEALVAPTVTAGCHLSGGLWHSLYDGLDTTNSSTFDIDHVVPLAEAWDSGASAWSADRRMRFANDLGVPWSLLAVSAASNRSKGAGDPADWLPPLAGVRCQYTAAWLAIKVRWGLAIDPLELATLEPLARDCPDKMPVVPAP